ncbi:uncharacterized protein [Hemitrygon akajei]|uniref:uncharacterized protein n=1 Tax=Hemitrygon akajei TaxID=2704970 RepID=UPI003BF9AA4F
MCWWAVVVPLLGLVSLTCANDAGIQRRLTPQSAAAVPRPARKLAEASGPVRTLHRGTPIASRACAVGSILLYPGAIWTPEPCLVCACQTGGTAVCERTECLEVSCAGARVPPGRCCPVCPVSGEPGGSQIAGVDSADKRGGNRGRKPSGARVEGAKGWGGRGDGSAPRGEGEGRPKVDRARPPKWGRAGAKGGSWGAGGLLPILERAGLRDPGVGLREGRVGVKGREAGTRKEAAVVRKEETGIKKQEAGIKKQALGIKKLVPGISKQALGVKKHEAGVKKLKVGVRKVKEGARNEEARVTEQEVGTRKEELGTRKLEAGIQLGRVSKKPQADLRKSDPVLHSPEVGQKKWGSGHRKMEAGPGKEGGAGRRGTGAGVASGKPGAATRKWGTPPRGGGGRKEAGKRKPEAEPGKRPRATKAPVPFPPELLPPLESVSKIPSLPSGCILAERAIACPGNKLSVIPKLADPALHTLYLADNNITTVSSADFAHLPNIQWLDLSRNNVGDEGMDSEAFRNLTRLRRLNLDGNRLGKIPWLPPSLEELKLNDNRLTAIDRNSFRGLSRLLTLDLEDNGLDDGNLNPTSFRPLRKLVYLRLGRNRFRALPSGLPASLRELYLENNLIEEIPGGLLNKTTNLTILILRNNSLQENRISPQAWFHLR